ncbi:MAG: succinate dehydrogenase cytochrome b subunit [Planctomycetaceae bacterium]
MKWLLNALASSLGRKFVMAITGLLLCGFLVAHLFGNSFMLVGRGPYNDYVAALHGQEWFVKIAEVGLAILFLLHIYLAMRLTIENRAARRKRYAEKHTKIYDRNFAPAEFSPERWMFISGAIVLGFLLLHLADFTFEVRPGIDYGSLDPFDKAVAILKDPLSAVVYLIGSIVLGFHLGHGVMSAFRSLGLSHPAYNGLIKWGGVIFAVVIAAGFALFIPWAWLTH